MGEVREYKKKRAGAPKEASGVHSGQGEPFHPTGACGTRGAGVVGRLYT